MPIDDPPSPVLTLSARIGEALLRPRRAAARLIAGGRGGVSDAALLLALRVAAHQLLPLCRGVVHVSDEGIGALWPVLLTALLSARADLLLILGGGVLLALLAGPGERYLRPGLGVELSAQAWFGWLAVHLPATLLATALTLVHADPSPRGAQVMHALALMLGLLYFAVLWGCSLQTARAAAQAALLAQRPALSQDGRAEKDNP